MHHSKSAMKARGILRAILSINTFVIVFQPEEARRTLRANVVSKEGADVIRKFSASQVLVIGRIIIKAIDTSRVENDTIMGQVFQQIASKQQFTKSG